MKAVMANVPEHILEWRRRTGADQWDEVWDGVLHMAPSPNRDHQDIEGALEYWLRLHGVRPGRRQVYHQINVAEPGSWPNEYRVVDLALLTSSRFDIDSNEYFEGGPDAVVDIRSPDDETYEKFDFYAKVGVLEIWVIDRDTRQPEEYELSGGEYCRREPNPEGWLRSEVADAEMRFATGDKLEIRMVGQENTAAKLP